MIKQSSTFLVDRVRIPYARYTKTFGMHETAYFYTIDMTDPEIRAKVESSGLLTEDRFSDFELEVLAPIFYKNKEPLQFNLHLVFILPDDMPLTNDMWRIKDDLQYMRKLFLRASDFEKLLSEEHKKEICSIAHVGEEHFKIRNFNIVSNIDAFQNFKLLKSLSDNLQSPIVNIWFPEEDEYIKSIKSCDSQKLAYYYQKLWSMFMEQGTPENPEHVSSTEQRFLYLASVLGKQKHGQPLLLDGIGWRALDDYRRLNLISTLSDFSEQSGSIIVTCESKADTNLIKKKVYKANFIVPKQ